MSNLYSFNINLCYFSAKPSKRIIKYSFCVEFQKKKMLFNRGYHTNRRGASNTNNITTNDNENYFKSLRTSSLNRDYPTLISWNKTGTKIAYSPLSTNSVTVFELNEMKASVENKKREYIIRDCHSCSPTSRFKPHIADIDWEPTNDSIFVTIGGEDGLVKFWNYIKGQITELEYLVTGIAKKIKFNSNGMFIAVIHESRNEDGLPGRTYHLSIIDRSGQDKVYEKTLMGSSVVTSLEWCNNPNFLILGYSNGIVEIFKVFPESEEIKSISVLQVSVTSINDLAYDTLGRYLAAGSDDGNISLISTETLGCSSVISLADDPVSGLTFSSDGCYILACYKNGTPAQIVNIEKKSTELVIEESKYNTSPSNNYKSYLANGKFRPKQNSFVFSTYTGALKVSLPV